MTITYSAENYISINQLRDNFANGVMGFCEPSCYIRKEVNDASVAAKKRALTFNDSGDYFVLVNDAIIFYRSEVDGILHVLNGNTRIRSLFEMLVSTETRSYDFRDVPFKILEPGFTLDDLITLQLASNDNTEKHKPFELMLMLSNLQKLYNGEMQSKYKNAEGKPLVRELQVAVKDRLIGVTQLSKSYIDQMLKVAEQPDFVINLLKSDKISANTIFSIWTTYNKLEKDAKKAGSDLNISLEHLYQTLLEISGGDIITEKHLNSYVATLAQAGLTAGAASKTQIGDAKPAAGGGGGGNGKSDVAEAKPPITLDEFKTFTENLLAKFTAITPEHIQSSDPAKTATPINNLVKSSLKAILDTFDMFPESDSATLLEDIRFLVYKRFGDIDKIIERAGLSEISLSDVNAKLGKLSKPTSGLYDAVYNVEPVKVDKKPKTPKEVATEAVDVTLEETPQAVVTTIETDTHTATIS